MFIENGWILQNMFQNATHRRCLLYIFLTQIDTACVSATKVIENQFRMELEQLTKPPYSLECPKANLP